MVIKNGDPRKNQGPCFRSLVIITHLSCSRFLNFSDKNFSMLTFHQSSPHPLKMPWNNLQIAPDEHSELTTTSSQASSSSSSPAIASAAHSPIPTSTSLSIPPEPAPTTSSTVAVSITNSVQASTTDAIIPNPSSSAYVNHNVNNGVIRHIPIYIEKKSFPIKEEPRPGPSMSTSMNETYRPNKSPVVNSRASVPESGRVSRNYIQEVRQNGPSPYSNTKSQFSSPELNSLSRTLNSQSEENAYPPRTLSRINKLNVIMESGKSKILLR